MTYTVCIYAGNRTSDQFREISSTDPESYRFADKEEAVQCAKMLAESHARNFHKGDKDVVYAVESRGVSVWQHPGVMSLLPKQQAIREMTIAGVLAVGPEGMEHIKWRDINYLDRYASLREQAQKRIFSAPPLSIVGWDGGGGGNWSLYGSAIDQEDYPIGRWAGVLNLSVDDRVEYVSAAEIDAIGKACAGRNNLLYSRSKRLR